MTGSQKTNASAEILGIAYGCVWDILDSKLNSNPVQFGMQCFIAGTVAGIANITRSAFKTHEPDPTLKAATDAIREYLEGDTPVMDGILLGLSHGPIGEDELNVLQHLATGPGVFPWLANSQINRLVQEVRNLRGELRKREATRKKKS